MRTRPGIIIGHFTPPPSVRTEKKHIPIKIVILILPSVFSKNETILEKGMKMGISTH